MRRRAVTGRTTVSRSSGESAIATQSPTAQTPVPDDPCSRSSPFSASVFVVSSGSTTAVGRPSRRASTSSVSSFVAASRSIARLASAVIRSASVGSGRSPTRVACSSSRASSVALATFVVRALESVEYRLDATDPFVARLAVCHEVRVEGLVGRLTREPGVAIRQLPPDREQFAESGRTGRVRTRSSSLPHRRRGVAKRFARHGKRRPVCRRFDRRGTVSPGSNRRRSALRLR